MTKSVILLTLLLVLAIAVSFYRPSAEEPGGRKEDTVTEQQDRVPEADFVARRPAKPSESYVGSEACRDCHREISAQYDMHPMGQSMARVSSVISEVTGDQSKFSVPPEPGSPRFYQYEVIARGTELIHRESAIQRGTDQVICQKDVVVSFSVGSGKRGKSYISNHEGVLLMSPMTWYTQGHRWDMSPGYDLKNLHFQRRIVDGCVQCHASRPAPSERSTHLFEREPFHELAIGCERCHGPGEAHVRYRQSDARQPGSHDPIVNPGKLEHGLGDAVCLQCHLIGESRITRYGRSDFDFRPGDRVTDIWLTFLRKGAGVDDRQTTEAVSQVEQMLASTCYTMSEGKMGCVSCHDPHQVPAAENRLNYFNGRCLDCHKPDSTGCSEKKETRDAYDNSCVGCHMSSIKANDVPHTSQTDHRILRRPESPGSRKPSAGRQELRIFDAERGEIPPGEIKRANAIQMVNMAESTGNIVAAVEAIPILEQWLKNNPDDPPAIEALGTAYYFAEDSGRAELIWEKGLALRASDERFLRRLMFLYHDTGQIEKGVRAAGLLIEVNAWDYEVYGRLAHMYGQLGRLDLGISAAERAIFLNPSAVEIYDWLGNAYEAVGNTELREKNRRLYQSLAPQAR